MADNVVAQDALPSRSDFCALPAPERPRLVVIIDTEEEFDWSREFSRFNTSITALRSIHRVQRIFNEYNILPVYVIDYPVASQRESCETLREIHAEGRCIIGAHLHPWVNPPYVEEINRRNSFPGNLPRSVEAAKLRILGDCIAERFGKSPVIYKAGRYGIGTNTADILDEQSYEVDVSVCPYMDYSNEGGPDFTRTSVEPYWFGKRRLLELPLTVEFTGLLRRWGPNVHLLAGKWPASAVHATGVLARLRLLNKVWLSPEGSRLDELKQLVRTLYRDGLRIFSFTFHSPSLECGNTPYVTSERDLENFLTSCRRFFEFFIGEIGGIPATPLELKAQLAQGKNSVAA